ncbi:sulfite exporter TauE/SafE family protein [Halobellus sp. EA9]|uniref:sulfite exporter TauE/SafE family protein n=1 Tax=Halobellus sp. EA9 TaxID=3421647 RepID=UPI003EBE3264
MTAGTTGAAAPDVGVAALFVVGLFGGAHCLGMCGPLVTMYGERFESDGRGPTARALRQHALFNAGRTLSYAAIGALLGALGGAVVDAGALVSAGTLVRGAAGIVVGAVVIAVGVSYVTGGGIDLASGSVPVVGDVFAAVSARLTARVDTWATGPKIAGLGAMHGLLPCPILYPAFLYALSTGSAVSGGLALGALGLGTFPSLFVYGTVLDSVGAPLRRRLHRGIGVAFVIAGTIPLAKGLTALGWAVPHIPLPMPPMPT